MQFWQAGQTFTAQIPEMIRKKSTKMQKLFKILFFKTFQWRSRKQLESPADFYRQLAEYFLLDFLTKVTDSNFCRGKKLSPESFFWKWESSFDKGAEIFLTKPRDTFVQGPKKIRRKTLKKNVPKIFFWTCKFLFLTTPPKFLRQGIDKNPFVVQKKWKSVCFEKHFVSLNCSYGHVECSSNKPSKKRKEAKNFCSVSEKDKKFHLFPKQFFFRKTFL